MIDYQKLLNWPFPRIEQRLSVRDTIVYALGVGLGTDPLDWKQLRYVYEKDLQAFPSMASVLCFPGNWHNNPATGIDYLRALNAGTRFIIHRPLPTEGVVTCTPRIVDIVDKGPGREAIVTIERKVYEQASSELVCTVYTTQIFRGNGGFGGPATSTAAPLPPRPPDTAPHRTVEIATSRNQALIFRLHGDHNPLSDNNPIHVNPDVARAAGLPAPIFHGTGTLGVAAHAILKTWCDYDAAALTGMHLRYTSPLIPGDVVRTDMWREGNTIQFRCSVPARSVVVLDNAQAQLRG